MPTRRQTVLSVITAALWQLLPRSARAAERNLPAFNAAYAEKIAVPFLAAFETAAAGLVAAAAAAPARSSTAVKEARRETMPENDRFIDAV